MCTQGSLIYTLVENKIFIIFSLPLYHKYIFAMEIYPQKVAFRLLILDTKKSLKPWQLKVWQISKIAF
jgi:hypothetical protein